LSATPWDARFFATTRGRLLQQLRRNPHTVDELAQALDLTDNGIRAHLALLERDGLVREVGARRTVGSRKPSQLYSLTAGADRLFPKPYSHVLSHLLGVLDERLGHSNVEATVREVGLRIADEIGTTAPAGDARARLAVAADALNTLGGLAEVVEDGGTLSIRGPGCPLPAVVTEHAEVCLLTEAFVSAVSGLPVCEHCDRGPSPQCRFDVVAQ
jgi:predicted ArsR family transcriptional regulator